MDKSERQYVPGGDKTTLPIPIKFKKPGETSRGYEAPREYVPGGDKTLYSSFNGGFGMANPRKKQSEEELRAMMRRLGAV